MKKILYYANIVIVILTISGAVVAATLYFEGTNTTVKTQGIDIDNLKTNQTNLALAITSLGDDVKNIQINGAATLQLIHDLSKYRFQYDPSPSEMKGINNVTSTSDVQATSIQATTQK